MLLNEIDLLKKLEALEANLAKKLIVRITQHET